MSRYTVTDEQPKTISEALERLLVVDFGVLGFLILLAKEAPDSFFRSGFYRTVLYILCTSGTVLIGCFGWFIWISLRVFKQKAKVPQEVTPEEKIDIARKDVAMCEQLTKLERAKREHAKEMIERVKLDKELASLLSGEQPEKVQPWLFELNKLLENVKNFSEVEAIIAKKKEEYPQYEDILGTVSDNWRERLLRKQE